MKRHLILRLEAPLMSFGGTVIDAIGPTHDMPLKSMVTGLLANALGWQRGERQAHRDLQARLVMGARLDRAGEELYDFQTAQLSRSDQGWTTRGAPEGRAGGHDTYNSPHIRRRYFRADAFVTLALRLEPADHSPSLDTLAEHLRHPIRPLFIGRKPCLPARPVFAGEIIAADTVLEALKRAGIAPSPPADKEIRLAVPLREGAEGGPKHRREEIADVRDWVAGVHAGSSRLDIITLPRTEFPLLPEGALP